MTIERVAARRRRRADRVRRARRRQEHHRAPPRPPAPRGDRRDPVSAGGAATSSTACSPSTTRWLRGRAGPGAELARRVPARPRAATPTYLRRPRRHRSPARRRRGDRRRPTSTSCSRRATTTGRRATRASSIARALVAVRSFHRFCVEEGLLAHRPERGGRRAARAPGDPKALTEAEVEALLGAVAGDGPRRAARPGHPRDALRRRAAHQRAGRARPRRPRPRRRPRARARQGDEGAGRAARAHRARARSATTSPRGRPELERPRVRTRARRRRGVPQRPRRPADPPGRAGRSCGRPATAPASAAASPARAAALVRDPHARPRRRHPGGPGAARPRQPLDHPGVHEGVAGAAAGRLRRRPSPGPGAGRTGSRRRRGRRAGSRLGGHGRTSDAAAARPAPGGARPLRASSSRSSGTATTRDLDFDENFADSGQVTAERGEVEALAGTAQRDAARTSRTRWPSSTPAPTASASRAASASPRRGSRRCRRPASASAALAAPLSASPIDRVHLDEQTVIFFGCLVVAVILHEISHGVVALWFGDDTAKRPGRLTLNPIPHIDPFGSIVLPGDGRARRAARDRRGRSRCR